MAILRAHELCDNGFKMHGWVPDCPPQVYTIFSAPNYCGSEKNYGAIVSIDDDLLKVVRYNEVSRLE